ncbi:MAG TPA: zinc ABC transporter substrate-binding protein [Spirochaetia bacterium]|nr:zinc ABC transporter substrate-binding protein [Spirochaetia bacterium]
MVSGRKPPNPLAVVLMSTCFAVAVPASLPAQSSPGINVVAAENFYGNIAQQIGGDLVTVTSVMSDPNVDPHEYESNVKDAKAVADADLVIENGGGYDGWMDKLLSASPKASRMVLKGFDLAVKKLPDNEHVWYDVDNAQAIALAISRSLQKLFPQSAAAFRDNERIFRESLGPIREKMAQMAGRYRGTPISLTETIFLYQAIPLGLNVLTPFEFQKAIAEGNDPPADTVVETENQIRQRKVKILVYNEQTVSPITTKAQSDAKAADIPIVGVTETMPGGETYQTWMQRQLDELQGALVSAGS